MNKYTLAVAHNEDGVVLIRKTKPAWQAGSLNFVGGKVEEGESFLKCVVREFLEETGVNTNPKDWKYLGKMYRTGDFEVKMYSYSDPKLLEATTKTEEEVIIVNPDRLLINSNLQQQLLSNILTIYHFALSRDFRDDGATITIKYK